jgi:hypothetical protein
MPHEVVDETNGPGRPFPTASYNAMYELWQALGHEDGRMPLFDEVLAEIRKLVDERKIIRHADVTPLLMDDEDDSSPVVLVRYPDGMVLAGYSADDVLRIRAAEVGQ